MLVTGIYYFSRGIHETELATGNGNGFSPNFQGMFTLRGSRADKVLVGICLPLLPWQHFKDFRVLKFVGVPQPKPLHGFSPNFQDMFTPRGSTADLVLVGIRLRLVPGLHF